MTTTTERKQCRVERAYQVFGGGRRVWYVVDCACGWTSPFHVTKAAANLAYREHKERRELARW